MKSIRRIEGRSPPRMVLPAICQVHSSCSVTREPETLRSGGPDPVSEGSPRRRSPGLKRRQIREKDSSDGSTLPAR